jgi:sugar phosphate permease
VNEPPAFILTDINTFFAASKNVFKGKKIEINCIVLLSLLLSLLLLLQRQEQQTEMMKMTSLFYD